MTQEKEHGMTHDEMVTAIHEINLHTPRSKSKIRNWTPKKIKDWKELEADIRQAERDGYDTVTSFGQ